MDKTNGDLAGCKKFTRHDASCYRLARNGHFKKTGETLARGLPVNCGTSRNARNGDGNGTILFVRTNYLDPGTRENAWVKLADLADNL